MTGEVETTEQYVEEDEDVRGKRGDIRKRRKRKLKPEGKYRAMHYNRGATEKRKSES